MQLVFAASQLNRHKYGVRVKARVKYVTDYTYFVFVTDTDGTSWNEVIC